MEKAIKAYEETENYPRIISGDGRPMLYIPKHFGKKYIGERYVYEHRYIVEKALERKLRSYEIVHHKDGNKLNNNPKNLELSTIKKHCSMHSKGKNNGNWNKEKNKICLNCDKEFHSPNPYSKYNFCNRECFRKGIGKVMLEINKKRIGKNIDRIIIKELKNGLTAYAMSKKYGLVEGTLRNHMKKLKT
jgi:hypothetical protein